MTSGATKAEEYVRRVVTLPIERIMDSGWLDLAELRRFVDEAERLGLTGHNVRVWWTRGPQDEPPRLEVASHAKPGAMPEVGLPWRDRTEFGSDLVVDPPDSDGHIKVKRAGDGGVCLNADVAEDMAHALLSGVRAVRARG